MEAKKTIAILGLEKGDQKEFLYRLANDNRILIVSTDIDTCGKTSDYITKDRPEDEVELINCPKDGCWEADIIFIWNPEQQPAELLKRLQAVMTQKIVLLITDENASELPNFPHSKTVLLTIHPQTKEANLAGDNAETLALISQLLRRAGMLKSETN